MKHLSYKIYLTILVSLLLVVLLTSLMWRRATDPRSVRQAFDVAGELAVLALAPPGAPPAQQADAVDRLGQKLRLDLALFSRDRVPVAAYGRPLPPPPADREESGWLYGRGGPTWAIELADGRWLVARAPRRGPPHPALGLALFLGSVALIVALCAWPVVRGLTWRLEQLQAGVETLGRGELGARVEVRGRDEVARLAAAFNGSAERIESLIKAHRMLLANASHELRTPLSRIRLGLELAESGLDPARRGALATDIAELDQLIDEILLFSRLEGVVDLETRDEVDLLGLAAEEGARFEACTVSGLPLLVTGDPRLLRRMVRNLLDNAARHGAPPMAISIGLRGGRVVLQVTDQGLGIAPEARERVFEPFARGNGHVASGAGGSTTLGGTGQSGSGLGGTGLGGTGLGLALVRQIARRHGGDAIVDGPSEGVAESRVTVILPLAAGANPA